MALGQPPGELPRCRWAVGPLLTDYHDREWGVPVHDDRRHFEFLVLEAAQSGLSWVTVLRRRDGYRRAFLDFDPAAVAVLGDDDVEGLLADPGIIRNRRKVESTPVNARALLEVARTHGSFDAYIWDFVGGRPIAEPRGEQSAVPASTDLSDRLSADLRSRGFRLLGPVVCYSYLQAAGLVQDHVTGCFRASELAADRPPPGRR
jgi:DNA-3-methyladenine glycosylase I